MALALGKHVVYDDIVRMRERLYLTQGERGRKLSAFWTLLFLAAVIASAGVVADSTATVIGAMIVAPLMTPILGTALALVLADRRELLHNMGLVLLGALTVICIGYAVGLLHATDVVADVDSQVAGRVSPKLIDLVAALATGVVGAFALVRSDVSDTLPGVAIAISLVPPLAVVGMTLEAGAFTEALGALLLFATNVTAIIATGTFVLLAYRVRHVEEVSGRPIPPMSKKSIVAVIATVIVVAVPLAAGSAVAALEQWIIRQAQPVAEDWAAQEGWIITDVAYRHGALNIAALGPPPEAAADELRADLDDAGLEGVDVRVTLVVGGSKELPGANSP